MARRRYLSTEISQDKIVNRLAVKHGDFAALLYTWMIPHAGDDGTLPGDPEELLYIVAPGRRDKQPEDIEAALQAMRDEGLIEWDGKTARFPPASFYKYQTYIKPSNRACGEDRGEAPEYDGDPGETPQTRGNQRKSAKNSDHQRKTPQNAASSPFPIPVPSPIPIPPPHEESTDGFLGVGVSSPAAREDVQEPASPGTPTSRSGEQSSCWSEIKTETVRRIIAVTVDPNSRDRWAQLYDIAERHGQLMCLDEALKRTVDAKKRSAMPEKAGAYFNRVAASLLHERGVPVPVGSQEERASVRSVVAESLAAADAEAGPDPRGESP